MPDLFVSADFTAHCLRPQFFPLAEFDGPVVCHKWHIVRLATIFENAILRGMAVCIVSFLDLEGVRHAVEVQAEGLYEAAILGSAAFRKGDLNPGGLTELEVEVRSSIKHTLTVRKTQEWLERGVRTPKEAVLKERLRGLISS